jgi:glycosyltransferase involved in cell wall biosynthesis
MPQIDGLVSVIIPAYNAENFLEETINSVKHQSYSNWELIVINDGSTDKTSEKANNEADTRISLVEQRNAGVSAARNAGLQRAKGEYLVFLDADDRLAPGFIKTRVEYLRQQPHIGFAGGIVEKFPGKSKTYKPAAEDPEREILFFDPACVTVPSNYMIRGKLLFDNNIYFNTGLNSTADRFFILQLSKISKGGVVNDENAKLFYRVSERSMSHKVSRKLVNDNEQFYYQLKKNNFLPVRKRGSFKAIYFLGLAAGFFKTGQPMKFLAYFFKSFFSNPLVIFKRLVRK